MLREKSTLRSHLYVFVCTHWTYFACVVTRGGGLPSTWVASHSGSPDLEEWPHIFFSAGFVLHSSCDIGKID